MSEWPDASTPEERDQLKRLVDQGLEVRVYHSHTTGSITGRIVEVDLTEPSPRAFTAERPRNRGFGGLNLKLFSINDFYVVERIPIMDRVADDLTQHFCMHCHVPVKLLKDQWVKMGNSELPQYCWADPAGGSQLHVGVEEKT